MLLLANKCIYLHTHTNALTCSVFVHNYDLKHHQIYTQDLIVNKQIQVKQMGQKIHIYLSGKMRHYYTAASGKSM